MQQIKVLAFDTGGTILDWHGGLAAALAEYCGASARERDWHELANEYRRRSLRRMLGAVAPSFNIDDVHREVLGEVLDENGIGGASAERQAIARRWHELDAWPDFPPALARLRQHYICVSFTILSLSLVIDVSRRNGIHWDAVIPCEMLRVYKPRPLAYQQAANFLGVSPGEILMVACHNFDLDAACGEGYRTAFVHHSAEWGPAGPPASTVGSSMVVVDALDESAAGFYAAHGFVRLPDSLRLVPPMRLAGGMAEQ